VDSSFAAETSAGYVEVPQDAQSVGSEESKAKSKKEEPPMVSLGQVVRSHSIPYDFITQWPEASSSPDRRHHRN